MVEVESLCNSIAILNKGNIAFLGTVHELTTKVSKRYNIKIITEHGEDDYTANIIGETMLTLLENYKIKNLMILDIKISRGSLEQHFIDISKGES